MSLSPASLLLRWPLAWMVLMLAAAPLQAAERAIDTDIVVNAPLDQVWDAWTTREGLVSFFAPEAEVEARVGGAFHIHMDPTAPAGQKGADDMRFLALQPKKMISFDWNAPPHLAVARQQRTVVIVRFIPLGEKTTRVTLHHTGWGEGGEWDQAYAYFDRAWVSVLSNLRKRFDTGPQDWTAWLAQLRQWRQEAAAKAALAPAAASAASAASAPR
jgi:uncharacterized protein YndB with AHSA1/START domain